MGWGLASRRFLFPATQAPTTFPLTFSTIRIFVTSPIKNCPQRMSGCIFVSAPYPLGATWQKRCRRLRGLSRGSAAFKPSLLLCTACEKFRCGSSVKTTKQQKAEQGSRGVCGTPLWEADVGKQLGENLPHQGVTSKP